MAFNLLQLQQLSRQAGWAEPLVEKAAAIWMYESNGNPNAHNPRGEDSWGLCQINLPFHPEVNRARVTDPLYNLQQCYGIYKREGWKAWYNSNKKYNSNYQGIAAQSRAIYQSGGAPTTPVLTYTSFQAMKNSTPETKPVNYAIPFAVALLIGVIVTR